MYLRSGYLVYDTLVLRNVWTSLGLKYACILFINVPHMPPDNLKSVKQLKLLNFVVRGPSQSDSELSPKVLSLRFKVLPERTIFNFSLIGLLEGETMALNWGAQVPRTNQDARAIGLI